MDCVPQVTRLSLKLLRLCQSYLTFSMEKTAPPFHATVSEPYISVLLSLAARTADPSHSINYCPQLESLSLKDTELSMPDISNLKTIFLIRAPCRPGSMKDDEDEGSRQFRLSLQNCVFYTDPRSDRDKGHRVGRQEMSSKEFHQLQERLRCLQSTREDELAKPGCE